MILKVVDRMALRIKRLFITGAFITTLVFVFFTPPVSAQDNGISGVVGEINTLLDKENGSDENDDNDAQESKESQANLPYFAGKNFNKLGWRGSIMFNDVELESIYSALQDYDPEGAVASAAVVAGNNSKPELEAPPTESVFFVLQSILYFSPDDWSIWINNKKIENNQNFSSNLSIVKVTKDRVEFILSPDDLEKTSPDWKLNLISAKDKKVETDKGNVYKWDFQSPEGNVFVNSRGTAVKFILNMNQNINLTTMKVTEGSGHIKSMMASEGEIGDSLTEGSSEGTEFNSLVDEIFQSAGQ